MAPKKAVAANGEASEGPFKWEGPNDNKLLLITQGRYVKPEEYEQLTTAFPGTTTGSIRNRISTLRIKQRDLYDSLGWPIPEGGATKKTPSKKTPSKRTAEDADNDNDDVEEVDKTPSKKPRARKPRTPKKAKAVVETEGSESEGKKVKDKVGEEDV